MHAQKTRINVATNSAKIGLIHFWKKCKKFKAGWVARIWSGIWTSWRFERSISSIPFLIFSNSTISCSEFNIGKAKNINVVIFTIFRKLSHVYTLDVQWSQLFTKHRLNRFFFLFFRVKQILGFECSSISFNTIPDEVLLFLRNLKSLSSGMSFKRVQSFLKCLLLKIPTCINLPVGYCPFILKIFFLIFFFWFLQCLVLLSRWPFPKFRIRVCPNLSKILVMSCDPLNFPNHQAKIECRSFSINRWEYWISDSK